MIEDIGHLDTAGIPPGVPGEETVNLAAVAMEAMTTRLVPVFAMVLDLPPDYFAEAFAEPN